MAEIPELGKSAASERAAKEEETPEVTEVDYAFLVVKSKEGLHMISLDINVPVKVDRQATISEVKGALHSTLDDLNNQETAALAAQNVVMQQMQIAQKVADARTNQEVLSKLPQGLAG